MRVVLHIVRNSVVGGNVIVSSDVATLISLMNGPYAAKARLDSMFVHGLRPGDVGAGGYDGGGHIVFELANEASFQMLFLYSHLQSRQWKSVLQSRQIVE